MNLTTKQLNDLKSKNCSFIFRNSFDGEGDVFLLWFDTIFNTFVLEKNCQIIKSTKTINPILNKLELDKVIEELTETIN